MKLLFSIIFYLLVSIPGRCIPQHINDKGFSPNDLRNNLSISASNQQDHYLFKTEFDSNNEDNKIKAEIVRSLTAYINKCLESKYLVFLAGQKDSDSDFVTKDAGVDQYNGSVLITQNYNGGLQAHTIPITQEVTYHSIDKGVPVFYCVSFSLKLENSFPSEINLADSICQIQVQVSRKDTMNNGVINKNSITVKERILTYKDFDSTGQWQKFYLYYELKDLPLKFYNIKKQEETGLNNCYRYYVNNVEFKINQIGKSNETKLSVDRIEVSDDRGRIIMERISEELLEHSANELFNYKYLLSNKIALDNLITEDSIIPLFTIDAILQKSNSGLNSYKSIEQSLIKALKNSFRILNSNDRN